LYSNPAIDTPLTPAQSICLLILFKRVNVWLATKVGIKLIQIILLYFDDLFHYENIVLMKHKLHCLPPLLLLSLVISSYKLWLRLAEF
jgi:hypothetical protein